MGKFLMLDRDTEVPAILKEHNSYTSIIMWRPVQSGKTSDVLKLAEVFYKTSCMIFISDKNTALANQTNGRAKSLGFEIVNYRDGMPLGKMIRKGVGHKVVLHMLMEVNNLRRLYNLLEELDWIPATLVIDEADKSRNTEQANKKKTVGEDEEEEEIEMADGSLLPPVTLMLLQIKNLLKGRENSRTVFVSATPAAVLTAEKDNWLVMYKEPYKNYVGIGINHKANLHVRNVIRENNCKARVRWTNSEEDRAYNTFYGPVTFGVDQFVKAVNRSEDESITQIMLISLENRKAQQFMLAEFVKEHLEELGASEDVAVEVFNSDTKEDSSTTLADIVKATGKKKVILIAGFMASRGVSFTDYSDKENMFELILQVHYTKKNFPLNSSMQNMRVFGPARRTVNTPALFCNMWAEEDILRNFEESYRIIRELAEEGFATQGHYNPQRPLTQPYNFRYLKQGWIPSRFIYPSTNEADHLPIVP